MMPNKNNETNNNNKNQHNINILSHKIEEEARKHIINITTQNNLNNESNNNNNESNSYSYNNTYRSNTNQKIVYDNDAEKLLSNEFNRLTIKTRTEIQEEVHGVHCLAVDETPELVTNSLLQLSIELNDNTRLPPSQKGAYLLSVKRQQQYPLVPYYVCSDEFRLMYLRRELFDIKKAASCLIEALETLVELFGEIALKRKLTLQDFSQTELTIFKKFYQQILSSRDRSGRRIVIYFLAEISTIEISIIKKIGLYLFFKCAYDVEDQRKGVVLINWLNQKYLSKTIQNARFADNKTILRLIPIRISSIHLCTNVTPIIQLMKSIYVARREPKNRIRTNFVFGEFVEVQYLLLGFGIPSESIPITHSGTIKTETMKRFINIYRYIERTCPSYIDNKNTTTTNNNRVIVIDVPYSTDILIKNGLVTLHQTGNIRFRKIVQSVYKQHLLQLKQQQQQLQQQQHVKHRNTHHTASSSNNKKEGSNPISTISLISDIIQEINREKLRVLFWNRKQSWWNLISDEHDYRTNIYQRVSCLLKRPHFISAIITEATTEFLLTHPPQQNPNQNQNQNQKQQEYGSSPPPLPHNRQQLPKRQQHTQQICHMNSSTSIFQSQDGKKRKISNSNNNNNNNNSNNYVHYRENNNNDHDFDDSSDDNCSNSVCHFLR